MDPNILAIAKVIKDPAIAAARKGLAIGNHPVDLTVHITGSLKVGENGETDVRGSVDYEQSFKTLAGLMVRMLANTNKPLSDESVRDILKIAMQQQKAAKAIAETMEEFVKPIDLECTKVTGTRKTSGRVTTKLAYEILQPVAEFGAAMPIVGRY